ncbi:MAG TPA: Fe-S oxidoreductase [Bacteroidales bacterium]|nr:MAG: hypothetical protein A2X11_13090 [Bacteroidetes bacterium GWE2_42_24]OFY25342.1 MAG: hypothetical protein A2X09_10295 [Bacteroidetes bacterium GWF2_43_11]HBZ67623.1 Fe-S oxidoreductase [Bacteroidales bacterium]
MIKQIIFGLTLLLTLGVFAYTIWRLGKFFRFTKPYPVGDWGKRIAVFAGVGLAQTKILRRPVVGLMHALVFWGFLVITLGSVEMVIDGLTGSHRFLEVLSPVYTVIVFSGDIFAGIILVLISAFIARRLFMKIKRFYGDEMKPISKIDAYAALSIILLLMVSLLGLNMSWNQLNDQQFSNRLPVSSFLTSLFSSLPDDTVFSLHEVFWWMHILLIFIFANLLPYSKHFHVFTSLPNVLLSRLTPLGKLDHMPAMEKEVRMMMNPDQAFAATTNDAPPERFGVKDVNDVTWKNYLDALACTECGRCTSVCPANITGKKLSPRKIVMDVRARMKEKGPNLVKFGKDFEDGRSLVGDYITAEELWACTTCNACAQECPVNINQPSMIVDMRRYLVLEEAAVPSSLASMLSNIENNGAPWQYPAEEREKWMKELTR